MKNIIYLNTALLFLTLSLLCSCKKFVQVPAPKNQLITNTVFADSTDANAAVIGIYINMMQYFNFDVNNGGVTLYTGLSGDELFESNASTDDEEFYKDAITRNNNVNPTLWSTGYQTIYDANACIQGLNNSTALSTSFKNSLNAEALVIRDFVYFNLVNLYGPVPLITVTDYNTNRLSARTSVNTIYSQIIKDLVFAQANLSKNVSGNARANYYAATALLARVYLYQGSYSNALLQTTKILGSGNYALEPSLDNVFLATSNETIWCLAPVIPGLQTQEGFYFVPTDNSAIPTYTITPSLYNSFESTDQRKLSWVSTDTVLGQVYDYPYKYKIGRTTGTSTENYVVFRLAEQYLIDAEAKANMNDIAGAVNDINAIRQRAGLANFNAGDKQTVINQIITERQHELFCEWGHRWFDLKRLNLANTILGSEKTNWKSTATLYPVPAVEISANPLLTQNPGY